RGRRRSRRGQAQGNGRRQGRRHSQTGPIRARRPAPMKLPKAIWFGVSCIALVVLLIIVLTPWSQLTQAHLGLIMLALIVVAIMLGFPTAFTLMGMGVIFTFLAYFMQAPPGEGLRAVRQTLDL